MLSPLVLIFAALPPGDGSSVVPPAMDARGVTTHKMTTTSDDPLSSLGESWQGTQQQLATANTTRAISLS